jgi:hypothetical protein
VWTREPVTERTAVIDDDAIGDTVAEGVNRVCDDDGVRFEGDSTALTVGDRIEAVTVIDEVFVTGRVTELRFCENVGVSVRAAVKVGGIVVDEVIVSDGLGTRSTEPVGDMVKLADGEFVGVPFDTEIDTVKLCFVCVEEIVFVRFAVAIEQVLLWVVTEC